MSLEAEYETTKVETPLVESMETLLMEALKYISALLERVGEIEEPVERNECRGLSQPQSNQ